MRFRKLPIEVDAHCWDGRRNSLIVWLDEVLPKDAKIDAIVQVHPNGHLRIFTLEGWMRCEPGDWLIREPLRDRDRLLYPCKPDIFAATYEAIA
jgi:hypothetical protein